MDPRKRWISFSHRRLAVVAAGGVGGVDRDGGGGRSMYTQMAICVACCGLTGSRRRVGGGGPIRVVRDGDCIARDVARYRAVGALEGRSAPRNAGVADLARCRVSADLCRRGGRSARAALLYYGTGGGAVWPRCLERADCERPCWCADAAGAMVGGATAGGIACGVAGGGAAELERLEPAHEPLGLPGDARSVAGIVGARADAAGAWQFHHKDTKDTTAGDTIDRRSPAVCTRRYAGGPGGVRLPHRAADATVAIAGGGGVDRRQRWRPTGRWRRRWW